MTGIDVTRARAETPGVGHVLHFNNAGAALVPAIVLDTQIDHLRLEARIGGYEARRREADRIDGVYDSIARLIGCRRDEVAVVENATVAWAMAFYSFRFEAGDRILTARAEYASNYIAYLQIARRTGARIEVIPSDEHGATSAEALEQMLDERVKLISITHVPTNGGLVNPAAAIGRVARRHGIPYLLDACQSVGQLELNVDKLGCDLLSATGRKYLRGPRGTGFLYVRAELLEKLEPPMLDLHAARWVEPDRYELRPDARRFENWESNYAAVLGLGAAVDYALDWGVARIERRVRTLAAELRAGLNGLDGVKTHDIGPEPCGIVTLTVDGLSAAEVVSRLRAQSINANEASASGALLDARERGLPNLVRASVHYYNDEREVERFVNAIAQMP